MLTRTLQNTLLTSKKSILLLGPRQTGKSTLIGSLNPSLTLNLTHEAILLDFLKNPRELEDQLRTHAGATTVFIDEIQRFPSLLNTVQFLLDKPGNPYRFFFTGSSARKLRRGSANLLPGRIHAYQLGPLTCRELNYSVDVNRALSLGSLPGVWMEQDSSVAEKTLRTYAGTYLKEEIQAENLARNLEGFARFLNITAEWSGHFLDLAKMASASRIARQSAVRFFEILEDSLLVIRLQPFAKSLTRRLVQHPKFYFFDPGVLNGLLANFLVSPDRIGLLFEHLIVSQIHHSALHQDQTIRLSTYRTENGTEIDVIVERGGEVFAVELKASRNVGPSDLWGFQSFSGYYGKKHRAMVLYLDDVRRVIDGIEILPWQEGLKELGF